MIARLAAAALVLSLAAPALAQGAAQPSSQQPQQPSGQNADQTPVYTELVIVTASKSEEQLVNAPAAVSVISNETIQNSPAFNIGDLLRAVPGVNVTQLSARDVNITSRGATSTLSTSQLAVVDGRSVYLDFFGFVAWDFVPTNPLEIKQIEVIRGPASAVWGANAMTGVVNVITRTPREMAAQKPNMFTIGVGAMDRKIAGTTAMCAASPALCDPGTGTLFSVNGTHAQAVNDRVAYKVSAGYLNQDPMTRPVGAIVCTNPLVCASPAFNTPYPPFVNQGTSQPKFDARVDYDLQRGGTMVFAGGAAGTSGIIHTGIGPFNISTGSTLGYFTTRYVKGGRRVAFFTNILNGDASNLLAPGLDGKPLPLGFNTKTFDVEANDVRAVGTRNALSYGANVRHNTFDITLAPGGENRNEGGGYLQDEIFLNSYFRWVVGGRVDKFSSIANAVFSPRTTFMIKPAADQTFRISVNRAFRAPSYVNNNINTAIVNQVSLAPLNPALGLFAFPIRAVGNKDLKQETMTAFEVGYTGVVRKRATVTAAVYWNQTKNGIYFNPVANYTSANAPPRWPLPPQVLDLLVSLGRPIPSTFTYLNLGKITDKGIELGVDAAANRYVNVFANYSYQRTPVKEGNFSLADINLPPHNRENAGLDFTYSRFLGNISVSHTDQAYWQDVLDARFAGTTKPYTLANAGFGVRWAGEKGTTSIKVTNLANQQVMTHIFGDVMKRQVVGEARIAF